MNHPVCDKARDGKHLATGEVVYRLCLDATKPTHGRSVGPSTCTRCIQTQMKPVVVAEPVSTLGPLRPDLSAIALPEGAKVAIQLDGSILYEKTGWEPPPSIDGYVRDKTNKWLFHPLWPVCDKRTGRFFIRGECGCIQVEMKCQDRIASLTDCRLCKGE